MYIFQKYGCVNICVICMLTSCKPPFVFGWRTRRFRHSHSIRQHFSSLSSLPIDGVCGVLDGEGGVLGLVLMHAFRNFLITLLLFALFCLDETFIITENRTTNVNYVYISCELILLGTYKLLAGLWRLSSDTHTQYVRHKLNNLSKNTIKYSLN